jgi:pimeloyl-ACP methyl ester carboxylesterase
LVTIGSAATIKGHTKITNTLKAVVKSQGKSFTYKGAKDFQLSTLYKPTEVPQWHLETMAHESLSAPLSIARRTIEHLMVADYAQQLEDIDTDDLPTLLIWGEHDSMFPEQLRNNFSAALPGR